MFIVLGLLFMLLGSVLVICGVVRRSVAERETNLPEIEQIVE